MNISIEKKLFSESVYKVARFAERRSSTLPALSTILILASEGAIKMRATNLETGIDLKINGRIVSDGVVAVPASILQQIAGSLTGEGEVVLEHDGDAISLTSGTSKSTIKTVPYEDFPSIPSPEGSASTIVLSGALLQGLFSSIAACASASTVRPELASLYLQIEGGILTVVATDSFRLAEKKIPLGNKGVQGKLLIPAKNALDIAQAMHDDEITMVFDEHQCAFVSASGVIVSRLTSATYPDYRQIIPKESVAEATVLRKELETALKRTTIFSDSFQKIAISMDPKKSTLALYAKNADVGESTEVLAAKVSGEPLTLSFNHRFLAAACSLTTSESVTITAAGIGRPLLIRGVGDNSLLYLISPMNQ
ncbi:MAG: DNA polymerase III subunit beta [Candidatus Paceibacterota bacterium]